MRTAAIAVMIFVFFFVYHTQVVTKMFGDMQTILVRSQSQVYVYDHELFVAKTRDQAKSLILAGHNIDPAGFYAEQEQKLREMLASLPPNNIVIRAEAVVQGGRDVADEQ